MNYTVVFLILMFSTSFSFFPVNCKVYFGIPSFKSPPKRREGGGSHTTNFHTGRLGPYLQAPTDTIFFFFENDVLFSLFDGFVDNGQGSPFVLAFIH